MQPNKKNSSNFIGVAYMRYSKYMNNLKKYLSYAMQVILIIAIALLALWIAKEAFDLQSYWTPIIVAVLSTLVSLVLSIGMEKRRKHLRKELLSNTFVKPEDINFGINGFAFYDHEDCGYLDDLITLRLVEGTYIYDFTKSFSENARTFPKLLKIKKLFDEKIKTSGRERENLDHLFARKIKEFQLDQLGEEDNQPTLILNSIAKNREDVGERLEASNLKIEVIKSNVNTKKLIDAVYTYVKNNYPDIIEASYKTNSKPENKENFIDDFVCLASTIGLYGCLIKNIGGNDNQAEYYMHKSIRPYGIRLNLTLEDFFNDGTEIHYDTLSDLIDNQLNQSVGILPEGKKHFTDVIFEFDDEMKCYLLYSTQPEEIANYQQDFQIIYADKQFTPNFKSLIDSSREDPKLQFYLCYAQSIVRKYINKRFKQ